MAAIDDCELLYRSHPSKPGMVLVLVKNNNTGKTVKAGLNVQGSENWQVNRYAGFGSINVFPHQFQIIVPAGQHRLIGATEVMRATGGGIKQVQVSYALEGAVYSTDEPKLPPAKEVAEMLGYYESQLGSSTFIHTINLHHGYGLSAYIRSPPGEYEQSFVVNLSAFESTISLEIYKRTSWTLTNPRFYEVFALADGFDEENGVAV